MQLACPSCGTREARIAAARGVLELLKSLVGIYPLRCKVCDERWLTSVWKDEAWKYARCPKCYRQELSTWSEQYYNSKRKTTVMLRLGASPYRCPACRCNFASFKQCKDKFEWQHTTRVEVLPEEADDFLLPEHDFAMAATAGRPDVLSAPSPTRARGVPKISMHQSSEPIDPFANLAAHTAIPDVDDELEPFL